MLHNRYARDAISAIGLQRATTDWMPRVLASFAMGFLVGAGVALLLTPRRGAELRTEIISGAERLFQKGTASFDEVNGELDGDGTQKLGA